jgi:hypothetical protein
MLARAAPRRTTPAPSGHVAYYVPRGVHDGRRSAARLRTRRQARSYCLPGRQRWRRRARGRESPRAAAAVAEQGRGARHRPNPTTPGPASSLTSPGPTSSLTSPWSRLLAHQPWSHLLAHQPLVPPPRSPALVPPPRSPALVTSSLTSPWSHILAHQPCSPITPSARAPHATLAIRSTTSDRKTHKWTPYARSTRRPIRAVTRGVTHGPRGKHRASQDGRGVPRSRTPTRVSVAAASHRPSVRLRSL